MEAITLKVSIEVSVRFQTDDNEFDKRHPSASLIFHVILLILLFLELRYVISQDRMLINSLQTLKQEKGHLFPKFSKLCFLNEPMEVDCEVMEVD